MDVGGDRWRGTHTHTHCFGMVHHQVSWVFLHFQGSFYGRARLSECVSVFNKNEMNNMVLLWPGDRSTENLINIMLSNLYFDRLINSIDSLQKQVNQVRGQNERFSILLSGIYSRATFTRAQRERQTDFGYNALV